MNNKPHFLTQFGGSANWEKYDAAIKLHKNVVALKKQNL